LICGIPKGFYWFHQNLLLGEEPGILFGKEKKGDLVCGMPKGFPQGHQHLHLGEKDGVLFVKEEEGGTRCAEGQRDFHRVTRISM
jgi:hypothetical protein